MEFAKTIKTINYDMVYTIAAYHDIAHYIDAKNHEKLSAQMLLEDKNLSYFFTKEQIKIMAEAVYAHRASMDREPRNIYGKIISSADRNTLVEMQLKRAYNYSVKHNLNYTLDEIIEECRQKIINKYGQKGYATEKIYFDDDDFKKFLIDIEILSQDPVEFKKRFIEVNNL